MPDANVLPERNKEEQDGERVIRRERDTGEVSRSFSFGSQIDDGAASAQYQDGILTLTLPKRRPPIRSVCRSIDSVFLYKQTDEFMNITR